MHTVTLNAIETRSPTVTVKMYRVLDALTIKTLIKLGHPGDFLAPSCDLAPRRWEEHQNHNGRGSGWTVEKGVATPEETKVIEALETLKEFFHEA